MPGPSTVKNLQNARDARHRHEDSEGGMSRGPCQPTGGSKYVGVKPNFPATYKNGQWTAK